MIIKEIDNITYQINLPNSNINIYNKDSLERITKKIFKKITNKKKLNPLLILDIYENNMYGTIITLKHYKSMFNIDNEYEVKIHVHTNPTFLYKIDYFTINNHSNSSIYYYKNNYYLKPKKNINKKEYLKECIESLIQQTYDGLNIIIVDDGSNDGSELICDFYSDYPCINIIHKQNQGCISSRYEGLKNATTEYVAFVDGDDFVKNNMYEFLMNFAAEYDADIITGGCVRYWDKDDYKMDKGSAFEEGIYNKKEIMEKIVQRMLWAESKNSWDLDPSLCFKIIKKDIILKEYEFLKDETFTYGEDTAIIYPLIFQAKKIYITNEILYYHRQRERNVIAPYILNNEFFEYIFIV